LLNWTTHDEIEALRSDIGPCTKSENSELFAERLEDCVPNTSCGSIMPTRSRRGIPIADRFGENVNYLCPKGVGKRVVLEHVLSALQLLHFFAL
jgi:hypothetical protein